MEWLLESCSEKLPHAVLLKDEQKEVVFHLLRSQDIVTILRTSLGKSLIYQLYAMAKEMQMNVIVVVLIVLPLKGITKEEVIEMEKLGIPSIIMSTKDDMLLPIKRLVFGTAEDF